MNHNEDLKLIGLSIQVPTTWLQNACVPRRSVHLCTSWLAWSAGLYVAPSGLCLELEDAICARSYPHNHFREPSEIGRIWKVRNTLVCILHIKSDINISILHALLQTCVSTCKSICNNIWQTTIPKWHTWLAAHACVWVVPAQDCENQHQPSNHPIVHLSASY